MGCLNSRSKIICTFTAIYALKITTCTFDLVNLPVIAAELIGGFLMLCVILSVKDDPKVV